jgi:hypothetical protein
MADAKPATHGEYLREQVRRRPLDVAVLVGRRDEGRAPPPERQSTRRLTDASRDERWTHLGELDLRTGRGQLDFAPVDGWRPLGEFLWNRWRP